MNVAKKEYESWTDWMRKEIYKELWKRQKFNPTDDLWT